MIPYPTRIGSTPSGAWKRTSPPRLQMCAKLAARGMIQPKYPMPGSIPATTIAPWRQRRQRPPGLRRAKIRPQTARTGRMVAKW